MWEVRDRPTGDISFVCRPRCYVILLLCKAPLVQQERLYALALSICSSHCLSVAKMRTQKRDFLKKQFTAIDVPWLCKESIIGLLTFKTAEIRHLENRQTAISQRKNNPIFMKFGKQMQIQKSVTVTWPNTNVFKIQDGGRRVVCSNIILRVGNLCVV